MTAPLILCVEDEPSLRDDIAFELHEAGYAVAAAADAREALAILESRRPDLILCDILMPGMDGRGFISHLRKTHPDLDDVPFVFLTALSSRQQVIDGRIAGADDYLTKPIDYDLLRATVESRLNRMQRLRAMPGNRSGLAALDRLAIGVVLLDAKGGVVHANPLARRLSDEAGIVLGGRIAMGGEDGRKLTALIAALISDEGVAPEGLRLDGEYHLMVVGMSLPARAHHDDAVAMLILNGADGQPPPDNATLGQLFDLTPMEAQVTCLLAEGLRRNQIAERLAISGTTVAFHLRNIFAKTGVQRQAELVALVLSVPMARSEI
ncbi:response regulator [Sulfitobacter sp. 1A12779]|uniref:response regulator n=1 Tax=Sulfitobacter sp. 1A12779 TaxID=3368599 RepID=UPI0037476170